MKGLNKIDKNKAGGKVFYCISNGSTSIEQAFYPVQSLFGFYGLQKDDKPNVFTTAIFRITKLKDFKEGETVLYKGVKADIEETLADGNFLIVNPFWDWHEEQKAASLDELYNNPFYISVRPLELTKLK